MLKLGISVEGQTEAFFVKYSLKRYLLKHNIEVGEPVILGGNVNLYRVAGVLDIMSDNYDAVTSLYDFYGFQGKQEGESCDSLVERITKVINNPQKKNIIPYVQLYEFESLLFSDPQILCELVIDKNSNGFPYYLEKIYLEIGDKKPEQINDSILTAPSKRIQRVFRHYKKTLYGFIIAQEIGIEKIRSSCPRFNAWIESLIKLAANNP